MENENEDNIQIDMNATALDVSAIVQRRLQAAELLRQSKAEQNELMEALKNDVLNNGQ